VTSQARQVRLERTFDADVEDLWELWTTRDGFESWWGPEGFATEVRQLEVEIGGETVYAMIATGADQVDFLRKAGMPLESVVRMTLTDLVPMRRLAYSQLIDFLPGVAPYRSATQVEFSTVPEGARMIVTLDVMHDEQMTRMAELGMAQQLGKLEARFRRTA
jgi:uncharacterized protein YndB with AHSA1/START domain